MACSGDYAEAWEFGAFWCISSVLTGVDDSGLLGQVVLTDSQNDFLAFGIQENVGMMAWNLTTGLSGRVTSVTEHTLGAAGVLWNDGDEYRLSTLTGPEIATIDLYMGIAASDLHSAMAAQAMCDCTLASWADEFLKKLNIIDAAIYHQCPCARPTMTDDMRKAYLQWVSTQLELIRTGKIDLCQGATGAEFPAISWAEQSTTEFAGADIIKKDLEKGIP